ncbi:MAG: DUF2285 domain-containing protein [Hyphomonas sp.]|uniref:DNA -binding domain-containing protein n=1 Tax=Hyphomonas sp. TaxID=87 RepID=UPI0032651EEF
MLVRTIEDLSDTLVRYDYTANLSRGNWAWEFARRNPTLRAAAYTAQPSLETRSACCGIQLLRLPEQDRQAENWGLLFFPNPDQSALTTHVFWSDKTYPRKVAVHVREREPGEIDEIFEKSTRLCKIVHLVDALEHEHILVKGKKCSIQVRCSGKSLLSLEPVKMEFSISGFSTLHDHVNALNRAQKVYGDDDTSPPVWSRKGLGYRNALVALDAQEAGLSYRETAMIFYGEKRVSEEWAGPSSAMKSEMARLLAKGQRLRDGGYCTLLEENL